MMIEGLDSFVVDLLLFFLFHGWQVHDLNFIMFVCILGQEGGGICFLRSAELPFLLLYTS